MDVRSHIPAAAGRRAASGGPLGLDDDAGVRVVEVRRRRGVAAQPNERQGERQAGHSAANLRKHVRNVLTSTQTSDVVRTKFFHSQAWRDIMIANGHDPDADPQSDEGLRFKFVGESILGACFNIVSQDMKKAHTALERNKVLEQRMKDMTAANMKEVVALRNKNRVVDEEILAETATDVDDLSVFFDAAMFMDEEQKQLIAMIVKEKMAQMLALMQAAGKSGNGSGNFSGASFSDMTGSIMGGAITEEYEALKQAYAEQEAKMEIMEKTRHDAVASKDEMKNRIEFFEKQLSETHEALEETKAVVADLKMEKDEVLTRLTNFEDKERDQDRAMDNMSKEVLRATEELEAAIEERDEMGKELSDAQDIIAELRGENESNKEQLRRASENLNEQLDEVKRKMTLQFESEISSGSQAKEDLARAKKQLVEAANQKSQFQRKVDENFSTQIRSKEKFDTSYRFRIDRF